MTITHTILWIDDQVTDTFISFFRKNGINTIIKSCYKEGINFLENPKNRAVIDAVILDVNCKYDENEKAPSAKSFKNSLHKVIPLCTPKEGKFIPWFVLTAGSGFDGAESLDMMVPEEDWTLKQFYFKGDYEDLKKLVEHIKQLTAAAPNVALRNQYPGIWGVCHEKAEVNLMNVFEKLKKDEQCRDTSIFLDMRYILAATVTRGKQSGLFPDFVSKPNEAKTILKALSMADDAIVPLYISYNYAALCDTVNNGCHSDDEDVKNLKVYPDVYSGNAPYLVNASFYQLLTILRWFGSLSCGEKTVPVRTRQVDEILGLPTVGDKIRLEKDGRILHYKNACAWCKDAATFSDDDLKFEYFEVFSRELNTSQSSKEYPFFIKVKLS